MKFKMVHENHNVKDLNASLAFYREALGLEEKKRIPSKDGSFTIVFVGNAESSFELELTWWRDRPDAGDQGKSELHLAFQTDDFEAAHAKHAEMGCICSENKTLGVYYITDPDGFWLEILPPRM